MAICVEPNGTVRKLVPKRGKFLSFQELRKAVDGGFRILMADQDNMALVNLMHRTNHLPKNANAAFMLSHMEDTVNGAVVFITKDEFCLKR